MADEQRALQAERDVRAEAEHREALRKEEESRRKRAQAAKQGMRQGPPAPGNDKRAIRSVADEEVVDAQLSEKHAAFVRDEQLALQQQAQQMEEENRQRRARCVCACVCVCVYACMDGALYDACALHSMH